VAKPGFIFKRGGGVMNLKTISFSAVGDKEMVQLN